MGSSSMGILLLFSTVILLWGGTVSGYTIEMGDRLIEIPLTLSYVGPVGCIDKNCDSQGAEFVRAAIEEARDQVNSRENLTYYHNVTVRYIDTSTNGLKKTIDEIDTVSVGVFGLPRDCATELSVLSGFNKMGAADSCSIDMVKYGEYTSTVILFAPSAKTVAETVTFVLNKFGWETIGLITSVQEVSLYYSQVVSAMSESLRDKFDVRIATSIKSTATKAAISDQVDVDVQDERIIVIIDVSSDGSVFFPYFLSLVEKGHMATGDFAVIAFLPFDVHRSWMEVPGRTTMFMGKRAIPAGYNITEEDLILAYRNLFIVSDSAPGDYSSEEWSSFRNRVQERIGGGKRNVYWDKSARNYDLINLMSIAGMEVLNRGLDLTDGGNYWEYMLQRSFKSVTGFPDYIDGLGMLVGTSQVYYFSAAHNGTYSMWPQAVLHVDELDKTQLKLTEYGGGFSLIKWIKEKPADTPPCGFKGERCLKPQDRILIISLCCGVFALSVLTSILIVFFRKYRYERRLHSLEFLIERRDVILKRHLNILSQKSMKSMKSMRSMASMGGSIVASRTVKDSHFILEDYDEVTAKQEKKKMASVLSTNNEGELDKELEDEKWDRIEDFAVGLYSGENVGLKRIYKGDIKLDREIRKEILDLLDQKNTHIIEFRGIIVQSPNVFMVSELAVRGSIKDILDNDQLPLEELFLNQMSKDIVDGMEFLHHSVIGCHGRLKSSNCLIDNRWMVRLSSFGLRQTRMGEEKDERGIQEGRDDLWSAPELLRMPGWLSQSPTILVKKADIYSLSILLYEIYGRNGPWGDIPMEPKQIVDRLRDYDEAKGRPPLRPALETLKDSPKVVRDTIAVGWVENPMDRPSMGLIKKKLKGMTIGLKKTIMDSMVSMIEKYTSKLEKDIADRNEELEKEKQKAEQLLRMMLPPVVADSLKSGGNVSAEMFANVTVYFSDCPGFAQLSSDSSPIDIVNFLNDLYTVFDAIIGGYDVYKVETIADAYMCVSGLPIRNGPHHVGEIASMGLALLARIKTFDIRHRPGERVKLRIGMHSGPCVAGVVGLKMPRYCLFGDTVNTASRMESNGVPLRINCSKTSKELLDELGGYESKERGMVEMKGKGMQMTYFITGEDENMRSQRIVSEKYKHPSLRYTVGSDEKKEEDNE